MDTIVISLGGSVLAPEKIDVVFLKKFRNVITSFSKRKRFVIICGGGKTARDYMSAASKAVDLTPDDLDWLGIHATRLNAQLLRNVFRDVACPRIIKNPNKKISSKHPVVIAAGWKPGRSTDHIATLLAKNFGAGIVVNVSNTDYVYDKDPLKNKDARPLKRICWKHFRRLIKTTKWNPGLSLPFDPIAAKEAEVLNLDVVAVGPNLNNLKKFLEKKNFKGTLISPSC